MHNPDYNTYEYEGKVYHEVDARMLWSLSHMDGVMTGIADFNGQICYAKCHQYYGTYAPRYFWLYPLTKEEIHKERMVHKWFQKYIGLHCDFDESGSRRFRRKPQTWQELYWEYARPFWNKSLKDMFEFEKELGIRYGRATYTDREALGFFTFERISENLLEGNYMSKIELIYHSNYWDGPLSGVCKFQGHRYWFDCVHDYHDTKDDGERLDQRIYGIYRITDSEWQEEDYWHGLFEKYVGTHTSYVDGKRSGKVGPSKDHSKFYDASKEAWKSGRRKKKVLTDENLIGYFDRSEMKFRKSKYRNYWLEGESPHCTHRNKGPICGNHELVEWRNDAQKWDDFEHDFDGNTSGWAVCIQPDGPDEGKPFWLSIKFCPWCGQRFKETGKINGLSFEEKFDKEKKANESSEDH